MRKKYLFFLLLVLLFPSFVFAKTGEDLIYYINQFDNRYDASPMMREMINILGDLDLIEYEDETDRIYDKRNNKYMCSYNREKNILFKDEEVENSEDEFVFDINEYCSNTDDDYGICEIFLDRYDRIVMDFTKKDFEPIDTIELELRDFWHVYFEASEYALYLYEYILHEDNDILNTENEKNACHYGQVYLKSKTGKHLMTLRETGIEEKDFTKLGDVSELDNITVPISDKLKEYYESHLGFSLPEKYKYVKIIFEKENPESDIIIKSIKEKETSKNASSVNIPSKYNLKINSNLALLKQGDYVTYEILFYNKSNDDLIMDLSNIEGEYTDYIIEYPNGKKIKANGEQTINLRIQLKKDPDNSVIVQDGFIDSSNAKVLFYKTLDNPKTYRNIIVILLLIVLVGFTLKSKNNKKVFTALTLIVALVGFTIPVKADDSTFITINSKVNVSNNLTYKGYDIENEEFLDIMFDDAFSELNHLNYFPDSKVCSNRTFAHFEAEQTAEDMYRFTLKNFPSKDSSFDVVLNVTKEIDQATNRNKFVIEECRGEQELYTSDFLKDYAYNRNILTDSSKVNEYINDYVCTTIKNRYFESPNMYSSIQYFLDHTL